MLLRKAAPRTADDLSRAIGAAMDILTPAECANDFAGAAYAAYRTQTALAAACSQIDLQVATFVQHQGQPDVLPSLRLSMRNGA